MMGWLSSAHHALYYPDPASDAIPDDQWTGHVCGRLCGAIYGELGYLLLWAVVALAVAFGSAGYPMPDQRGLTVYVVRGGDQ